MLQKLLSWPLLVIGGACAQRSCNGSPSLCDRRYSNVTFVGAHDSPFVGLGLSDNQYLSVKAQMDMGVRFLQGQTHNKNNAIQMCHTSCDLRDAGSLATFLAPVRAFLDANPNEVVSLLLTNGDNIPISKFGDVFKTAGLDTYAFAPGSTLDMGSWPTLGELIDRGRRLVVFMGRFTYHLDSPPVSWWAR